MGYRKCIDISNWQAGIDIGAALAGVDMIVFKASEGEKFVDAECAGWVGAAKAAGKPFGVYHFFRGRGLPEADHFLAVCKEWVGQGVLILDVEAEGCSAAEVELFARRVFEKTGVWPWVYTSASFVGEFMNDYVREHCALWCAGYPTQPATWTGQEFPYGNYTTGCTVAAWQFTDRLAIAGMEVDGDAVYITAEQWAKYAKPETSTNATKRNGGETMALPLYEKFAQVMEHLCRHDGDGGHGYTQAARWGDGTYETITLSDGSNVKLANGDRDCSSGIISALEAVGVDCKGASYTGNMKSCLLATGLFKWVPIDQKPYARRGDIYLSEAHHTAMCTSDEPDMLCQFSISENGTIYGKQGDQTGDESNFRAYYDYPWDGRLEWIDREGAGGGAAVVTDDIDKLANDVINGVFGNGNARKAALGDKYEKVQARVNEILGGGGAGSGGGVDVDDLARRVIAGEFGNGDARKKALGSNYDAVQKRVNEILGGSGSGGADIDALARAVIRGDYGNGDERRRRLGSDYDAVQRRVNELLS